MPQAKTASRPNIIFSVADDLGSADLGCYGGTNVSPNLDRLAQEGLLFTRAYSNSPVCSLARFAMMTGRCVAQPRSRLDARRAGQMKAVQRYSLPDPPFTHHDWLGYSEKELPAMDHMGTEMLVLDRSPVP